MKTTIRKSILRDLDFLEKLESTCFPKFQQSNRRAIRYSISSPFQKVVIAEIGAGKEKKPVGSAIIYLYAKTLRIFSIAVLPEMQGQGVGKQLLEYAVNIAKSGKIGRITLEVRKSDSSVVKFYENAGFKFTEELQDYYAVGEKWNPNGFTYR